MRLLDITGEKFGRWTVVRRVENSNSGQPRWQCVCDCGNEKMVLGVSLRKGTSESCGCLLKEKLSRRKTHGLRNHRLYRIWNGMLTRCNYPKHSRYKSYGGRGIKVCDRWLSVENFYSDMIASYENHVKENGEKHTTLDRLDVDGNYEITNVKWSTHSEQNRNKQLSKLNTSGYKGVHLYDKEKDLWRAVIYVNKKCVHLGLFEDVEEAAKARRLVEETFWDKREVMHNE